MSAPIYLALLHYPMTNRKGDTVTTSVTNLDIHDIARSCRTFCIKKYFIVTPLLEQHQMVGRILGHWDSEHASQYHPDRAEALSLVRVAGAFEEVRATILQECGQLPEVVLTDARKQSQSTSYSEYRKEIEKADRTQPSLLVFGTGWGVAEAFHSEVSRILEPIWGVGGPEGFNHLSVRSAVAIILDRLLGSR